MANLGFNFKAAEVAPSGILPPGDYKVTIVDSDVVPTKAGTGSMLVLHLQVTEGPHADRALPVPDRIMLSHPNPQVVDIGQRKLSALCRAAGVLNLTDSTQLHGRIVTAKIKVRPAGPDKSGIERDESNEITGYRAADELVSAAA